MTYYYAKWVVWFSTVCSLVCCMVVVGFGFDGIMEDGISLPSFIVTFAGAVGMLINILYLCVRPIMPKE